MHSDPKKANVQRRDHANFAPNSREKIANFRKIFGAPRAEKLREIGQRCCENRRISLQLFYESVCVLMQAKARGQRRDHAKIAKKSGEKFAKFPEIRHAPRILVKNCVQSAIARCAYCTMSLRAHRVSIAFRSEKKQTFSVGITQILRPTRAKELQLFRKTSARRAQKNCVNSARVVAQTIEFHCNSFSSRYAF